MSIVFKWDTYHMEFIQSETNVYLSITKNKVNTDICFQFYSVFIDTTTYQYACSICCSKNIYAYFKKIALFINALQMRHIRSFLGSIFLCAPMWTMVFRVIDCCLRKVEGFISLCGYQKSIWLNWSSKNYNRRLLDHKKSMLSNLS